MMVGMPVPFTKVVSDATGGNTKVQRKDFLAEGVLPVIDQGQKDVAGYTNDLSHSYTGDLPVVLFGDHTRAFKYVDRPFALGADGVKVLAPRAGFNAKYLYYFFLSCEIPSRGYSRHFKFLKELEIPLFAPSEQGRIVELLDEADCLRRLRCEADTKIARILPALFLNMFGDPVTNPMGWPQGTLSEFGVKARYGLGQPPKQSNSGLALLRATNVDAGRIVEKNLLFVDKDDVPRGRNAFLAPEEVIVVRSGAYTGDVAQVTEKWAGSVAGYDLVVTPAAGWSGEFIEQFLLTPFVQKTYFESQKGRAGQPHLNSTQLEATPAFNPPESLQIAFSEQVRAIRRMRDQCIDNGERLEQTFKVLLQRAFSGQLTTKWRETRMQELLTEMAEQVRTLHLSTTKELGALL